MMAEYIEREVAVSKLRMEQSSHQTLGERMSVNEAVAVIEEIPTADVAEVVHARWERVRSNWHCTGCHKGYRITNGAPMASSFSYCPNCGAKMDGGNDDG